MGYTTDDSMVRVDFFKPSGKWYTTESIKWTGDYYKDNLHDSFKKSLRESLGDRLSDMDAVCLEPYHDMGYPLMIKNGGWNK